MPGASPVLSPTRLINPVRPLRLISTPRRIRMLRERRSTNKETGANTPVSLILAVVGMHIEGLEEGIRCVESRPANSAD